MFHGCNVLMSPAQVLHCSALAVFLEFALVDDAVRVFPPTLQRPKSVVHMFIHVYPCISMYIYVYLCISMYTYVYLCISMYIWKILKKCVSKRSIWPSVKFMGCKSGYLLRHRYIDMIREKWKSIRKMGISNSLWLWFWWWESQNWLIITKMLKIWYWQNSQNLERWEWLIATKVVHDSSVASHQFRPLTVSQVCFWRIGSPLSSNMALGMPQMDGLRKSLH